MKYRPETRAFSEQASTQPDLQLHSQLGFQTLLDRLPAETPVVFFEHLMRKLELLSKQTLSGETAMEAKDQWLCYLGLRLMHSEAKKSRFDRDIVALQATWKILEPLLRDAGILFASKNDPDADPETQLMLERFLANQPPLLQTLPRHEARAYVRKRASQRRRRLLQTRQTQHERRVQDAL